MRDAWYFVKRWRRTIVFWVLSPRLAVVVFVFRIRLTLHYAYGIGPEPQVPFSIYV